MKKFLALLIFVVIMLTMCGCSKEMKEINEDRLFQTVSIEKGLYGRVIADKTTGVMYWVSRGGNSSGILTMLVNPDGSPRVYKNIGGN